MFAETLVGNTEPAVRSGSPLHLPPESIPVSSPFRIPSVQVPSSLVAIICVHSPQLFPSLDSVIEPVSPTPALSTHNLAKCVPALNVCVVLTLRLDAAPIVGEDTAGRLIIAPQLSGSGVTWNILIKLDRVEPAPWLIAGAEITSGLFAETLVGNTEPAVRSGRSETGGAQFIVAGEYISSLFPAG